MFCLYLLQVRQCPTCKPVLKWSFITGMSIYRNYSRRREKPLGALVGTQSGKNLIISIDDINQL